jgi:hypothetical protein
MSATFAAVMSEGVHVNYPCIRERGREPGMVSLHLDNSTDCVSARGYCSKRGPHTHNSQCTAVASLVAFMPALWWEFHMFTLVDMCTVAMPVQEDLSQ